ETSNGAKENKQAKNDPKYGESDAPSAILISRRRRLAAQRYARIVGDVFCQLPRSDLGRLAVIALPEVGHHGAAGVSHARVIDHRLEPVADFDAIFALGWSDEQ